MNFTDLLYWLTLFSAILYVLLSVAFFAFGFNLYYLAWIAIRNRPKNDPTKSHVVTSPIALSKKHHGTRNSQLAVLPKITVQLPIYNELYVAERIIRVAAELDYPADKLQIQVVDDSTDETAVIVQNTVSDLQAQGHNIQLIHRDDRTGFKAGALQNGMATATGDFIAIFDADFSPDPDFLRKTIPHMQHPKVAFVQTRWAHINRDYSWFTQLQAIMIDAHFMVEQFGRFKGGYWFNFNGTAGIWRREAMEDVGGWRLDTLTEDLDLSYRAFLNGWEAVYVRDISVPAELPVNFTGFRRQQHRWSKGSLECATRLIGDVWRTNLPFKKKFQALLHLFGYSIHILLFISLLIYPFVVQIGEQIPLFQLLNGFSFLLGITAFAPATFFILGQLKLGQMRLRKLPMVGLVLVVGSGLMFNTLRAAWQILNGRKDTFERTAKFGIETKRDNWKALRYQQHFDAIVFFELFFGVYTLATTLLAFQDKNFGIGLYSLLFGAGLLFVALASIWESIAVYRHRDERAENTAVEQEQWSVHS